MIRTHAPAFVDDPVNGRPDDPVCRPDHLHSVDVPEVPRVLQLGVLAPTVSKSLAAWVHPTERFLQCWKW
ncbi:MAG: hypothetical protein MK194_14160 [Roseibacillus sp.]|nr:hypothetical protein [Roseibacillus sp.]